MLVHRDQEGSGYHCQNQPPARLHIYPLLQATLICCQNNINGLLAGLHSSTIVTPIQAPHAAGLNFSIKHKTDNSSHCLKAFKSFPLVSGEPKATSSLLLSKYHTGSGTVSFPPTPTWGSQLSSSRLSDLSSEVFSPGLLCQIAAPRTASNLFCSHWTPSA